MDIIGCSLCEKIGDEKLDFWVIHTLLTSYPQMQKYQIIAIMQIKE